MKFNPENSDYTIGALSSLKDAMEKITANHRGSVVVVSDDLLVLGVLSDGDIRRAMVKGATMFMPVEKAMNPNFVSTGNDGKDREEILANHPNINLVPVVDGANTLVDLVIRGGEYKG